MRLIPFLSALLLIASFAQGQASSPKLPCDFSGDLLHTGQGQVVLFTSDEMKKRATRKVDFDAPYLEMAHFQGTIIVDVLVGGTGEVVCIKNLSGLGLIRKPVEAALRSWKFKPEKQNGKPVAYLGQLDFMLCNTGSCYMLTLLK
jgi:hypothetical protein